MANISPPKNSFLDSRPRSRSRYAASVSRLTGSATPMTGWNVSSAPAKASAASRQFGGDEVLRGFIARRALGRFDVLEDLPFKIADDDAVGVAAEHVLRVD